MSKISAISCFQLNSTRKKKQYINELKSNLCMEKQKDKLYYGVKWTKWHSLGGKLNQIIV